jgi:hypothetical protein
MMMRMMMKILHKKMFKNKKKIMVKQKTNYKIKKYSCLYRKKQDALLFQLKQLSNFTINSKKKEMQLDLNSKEI